jgi:hypothetical protein
VSCWNDGIAGQRFASLALRVGRAQSGRQEARASTRRLSLSSRLVVASCVSWDCGIPESNARCDQPLFTIPHTVRRYDWSSLPS